MEKEYKLPFWKRALASIKDFDKYQDFALENLAIGIKYFLKIMLVFSIVVAIAFSIKLSTLINKGQNYLKNEMPEFEYKDGILQIDQTEAIILEDSNVFPGVMIMDTRDVTEEQLDSYYKKAGLYPNSILLLKDKLILINKTANMQSSMDYKDIVNRYELGNFTKQQAIEKVGSINIYLIYLAIFFVMFVYIFTIYVTNTILDALLLAALGYITAKIVGLRLEFRSLFNMSVHALTLPLLLNMIYIPINLFTGFNIQYFAVMYRTISFIYIVTAILIIRSNLIKQQMELLKIVQEQEKTKEEIEQRQEEDKKKEESEDKKEEQPKEKEKKENKDTNIGKEAEGQV